MKAMKKVLALGLALAMVVSAVPATTAEAATASAKLNKKSVTLVAGTAKKQNTTIKVTTKNLKNVKVKSVSSNRKVVKTSVSKKTITVKSVGAGTAKVNVTVTGKNGTKNYSKKLTATVKVVKNTLTATADATTIAAGKTTKVSVSGKPATQTVTYTSSDEKVATVAADGTITGVAAGKATITATSNFGATATVDVEVKTVLVKKVAQTKYNVLVADIEGDGSKLTANNFVVTNVDTKVVNPVKSVAVDKKDATKLNITTYNSMTDGKNYTVTFDGADFSFVASDGKVADLTVSPVEITADTLTEIDLIPVDANGIELGVMEYGNTKAEYSFSIEVTKGTGYTTGSKLKLLKAGDEATATVKYTPGTVDANGALTGVIGPKKVVITAVESAPTTYSYKMAVGLSTATALVAKEDAVVAAKDSGLAAFIEIKDNNDKEIANNDYATEYTVESSDLNVLMLGGTTLGTTAKKHSVNLVPLKEGTAYIVLKDKKGNVVATFPVSVKAERTIASMTLDKSSATVYTAGGFNTTTVKFTLKDQYGDVFASQTPAAVIVAKAGSTVPTEDSNTHAESLGAVSFTGASVGVYTYKITTTHTTSAGKRTDLSQNFVLNVVAGGNSATANTASSVTFGLRLSKDVVDIAFNPAVSGWYTSAGNKIVDIDVVKYVNGIPAGTVTPASIKITNPNGSITTNTSPALTNTFGAVVIDASNIAARKAVGTYKFEVVFDVKNDGTTGANAVDDLVLTRSLTIIDSKAATGTARAIKTSNIDKGSSFTNVLESNFVYTYAGTTYTDSSTVSDAVGATVVGVRAKANDGTSVAYDAASGYAGKSVNIETVTLRVAEKNPANLSQVVYFDVVIPVNQTISINN